MSDIEEFRVDSRDFFPRSLDQALVSLKAHKQLKIIGTSINADRASRVAETLRRQGFIEFDDVKTETKIINDSRQVRLIITVHITSDFDKLQKEHEEERKKREMERKKRAEEKEKKEK